MLACGSHSAPPQDRRALRRDGQRSSVFWQGVFFARKFKGEFRDDAIFGRFGGRKLIENRGKNGRSNEF